MNKVLDLNLKIIINLIGLIMHGRIQLKGKKRINLKNGRALKKLKIIDHRSNKMNTIKGKLQMRKNKEVFKGNCIRNNSNSEQQEEEDCGINKKKEKKNKKENLKEQLWECLKNSNRVRY